VKFLVTVDTSSLNPITGSPHPGHAGFHPVAWCQYYDGGRVWATTLGHNADSFTGAGVGSAQFRKLLVQGIKSAMGLTDFCTEYVNSTGHDGGLAGRRLQPVARARDAEGAHQLVVAAAEHRHRHGGGLRVALAVRRREHLRRTWSSAAPRPPESAQHVAGGAHRQRQAVAHMHRVADGARALDAVQAHALVTLADVERGAFVQLGRQPLQHRRHDVRGAEEALVQPAQRQHLGPQPVRAVGWCAAHSRHVSSDLISRSTVLL
jgi:hypothetical protein